MASRSRTPSSFGTFHTNASNKKILTPLKGARTEKSFLRYHLACRFRGHSIRRQHAVCPITPALRRKILRLTPVPPALSGPFAAPHFRSALSTRNSLWTRMATLLPLRRFRICYAYLTTYVCVCQALFFACDGQGLCRQKNISTGEACGYHTSGTALCSSCNTVRQLRKRLPCVRGAVKNLFDF